MIEFVDIGKRFGDKTVLAGLSLRIDPGSVHFIIGTSGVGKSVLVKHVIGLHKPDAGHILLDGVDVTTLSERALYPIRKKCGMVFQHSTLFDSMSVVDNVALPLRKHKKIRHDEAREEALSWLRRVKIEALAERFPAELGDGLRKQVAIARALTMEPQFLIFDEPTTGLDPLAAVHVDQLIRRLADDEGVTCVVVSHDLRSIFAIADRIAMIYQGRLRLDGSPAAFRSSEDPIVQQFIRGLPEGPMEL